MDGIRESAQNLGIFGLLVHPYKEFTQCGRFYGARSRQRDYAGVQNLRYTCLSRWNSHEAYKFRVAMSI